MTEPFHYSTTYVLDKSHFSETFDESYVQGNEKSAYLKSLFFIVPGVLLLLFSDLSPYAAWFLIALGIIEALSVKFRKPWWLARQMISKAANDTLTLVIDDQGVASHSINVNSKLLWKDINRVEKTRLGWLLYQGTGKTYLSNRCLNDETRQFLTEKADPQT